MAMIGFIVVLLLIALFVYFTVATAALTLMWRATCGNLKWYEAATPLLPAACAYFLIQYAKANVPFHIVVN